MNLANVAAIFELDAERCARLVLALGHFLWQGSAVAALATAAAWALRDSAVARYRIYLAAMLLMAACPIATFFWLGAAPAARPGAAAKPADGVFPAAAIARPRLQASPGAATPAGPSPISSPAGAPRPHVIGPSPAQPPFASRPLSTVANPAATPAHPRTSWRRYAPLLAALYAAGAAVMLVRLLLGLRGARRLCRRSEAIDDDPSLVELVAGQARRLGMAAAPRVRRCADVLVPTVVGVIRPVILLPVAVLAGLTPEQLEAIVAHELAHVRRYDPILQLLQRLIEAALFFHPAVWFVSRRLCDEREHCCDDAAVRAVGGRPAAYAQSLLRVAELCLPHGHRAGGLSLAAVDGTAALRRRVMRLLDGGGRTPPLRLTRVWPLAAVIVAAVTLLGVGTWHRHGSDIARAEPPPKPLTELTGQLLDPEGRPVSNAYVAPAGQNPWSGVQTDASGRFTLKNLKPDDRQILAWSQRSRRMAVVSNPPAAPAEPLPVRLAYREGSVDGRVTDASGNPIRGAWVRLFVKTPDGMTVRFPTYAATDNTGYYAASLIPTGPGLTLHATLSDDPADPNATANVPLAEQFQVEMPDLVVHTTTAPSPKPGPARVRYSGRVVDEGGAPIAGAEIELSYPKNHMIADAGTVLTDREGRFSRLLPPDADRVELRVTAADFLGTGLGHVPTPATSALRDGSAVIALRRGLPLEGVVRDEAGRPVSNALVIADGPHRQTPGPQGEPIEEFTTPRTTADGHFRVGALPPGRRDVTVLADGFAPQVTAVDVKPGLAPLDVRLATGLTYAARVVDPDGKPIAGAHVGCDGWMVGSPPREQPLVRVAEAGADGRFVLPDLPREGSVFVSAMAGSKGYLSNRVTWSAEKAAVPETITLYKPPVITGFVRDADTDQPITQFEVHPGLYWSERDPFSESTFDGVAKVNAADGHFSKKVQRVALGAMPQLPTFAARIVARGYLPALTPKVQLGKPYEPFVIRLHKAAPIAGAVTDAAGQPVQGAQVIFVGPGEMAWVDGLTLNESLSARPQVRTHTDAKGAFELPASAEPGRVLVLHDAGYAVVDSGKADAIHLTPWARVEGDLIVNGKPVNGESLELTGAEVRSLDAHEPDAREIAFRLKTATRPDGKFAFERVPAMRVTLERPNGGGAAHHVEPKAGQTVSVHLGG